ncbi:MAG: hypothetical protein AAGA30_10815, partial [Planctomycetota bacterium]
VGTDALENARLEGANSLARLGMVMRANWLSIASVSFILFAVCFGELSASQLAVPPGIDTIPRRMLGLLHSGVNDRTAGLAIVSVGANIFLISISMVALKLTRRS